MAGIPLPALDIRPPAPPPNQLEQLGQLLGLKNAIQNAPAQQQILQQQAQAGQMENQQRQIQLNDQQAMTKAMQQWDGKDINGLVPLVVKNGGSAQAVMGLKAKALDIQKTLSGIASQDATTGSTKLKTLQTRNDLINGALNAVSQLPDDQLASGLVLSAQQLAQQGLLDPQHVQQAIQLAQNGDPNAIRAQLSLMQKQSMSLSQQMDAAQKQAQTDASNANTKKTNAEMQFYQQNGGAPGVAPNAMEMADWLKKNPGKGPSDFYVWQQHQNPWLRMMNENFLGGAGPNGASNPGLDLAAQNYLLTGQMPAGLYRSVGTTQAIINRAAQMNQQLGGAGIAANKAVLQANEGSLKNLQKNYDQVEAFEQTAQKNMDLLQDTAKSIPDLSGRFANVPVRMFNARMLGTENMAKFNTALNTAQMEAAKVLNSSNATGVLSDSARHELQQIIDGNLSYRALVGSLNTLKQDMNNRTQSYQLQIGDIQNRIKGAGSPVATQEQASPKGAPAPQNPGAPVGATMKVPGSDGKMHWSDGKHDLGVAD